MRMWSKQRQTVVMVTHDIQEAVLLSDRVLVFSRRPGRVIADVPVDLARPRQPEDAFDPDFAAVARQIRETINRA
jgi:NitT/TauT family transport system ATP-binding protein